MDFQRVSNKNFHNQNLTIFITYFSFIFVLKRRLSIRLQGNGELFRGTQQVRVQGLKRRKEVKIM